MVSPEAESKSLSFNWYNNDDDSSTFLSADYHVPDSVTAPFSQPT